MVPSSVAKALGLLLFKDKSKHVYKKERYDWLRTHNEVAVDAGNGCYADVLMASITTEYIMNKAKGVPTDKRLSKECAYFPD
jgi:hypothetical protein